MPVRCRVLPRDFSSLYEKFPDDGRAAGSDRALIPIDPSEPHLRDTRHSGHFCRRSGMRATINHPIGPNRADQITPESTLPLVAPYQRSDKNAEYPADKVFHVMPFCS